MPSSVPCAGPETIVRTRASPSGSVASNASVTAVSSSVVAVVSAATGGRFVAPTVMSTETTGDTATPSVTRKVNVSGPA